ncbi:MAG: endonuclease/exonuclease/phosphatase family protein [Bifidobacteriaceae bacterium]|jgi:exodeoxyribonuclease-3|nr:endonuclease/exonuclease/phosphatase family protein [Bifidobacteriaceae bacterium]
MITVASVNCAGLRGSNITGKSANRGYPMSRWLKNSPDIDILALQETRVNEEQARDPLLKLGIEYEKFFFQQDNNRKGHSGVALIALRGRFENIKTPFEEIEETEKHCFSGRWIEADYTAENGAKLKVVSAYLHHADSPKVKLNNGELISREKSIKTMDDKHIFMSRVTSRLRELKKESENGLLEKQKIPLLVVGDFNIAHHDIDIKNSKGNIDKAGFLPEERAWVSLWMGNSVNDERASFQNYEYNPRLDYSPPKTDEFERGELGLVDVHRQLLDKKEVYTWWSNRGRAFDNDTGWRIDYQMASPDLAKKAVHARVDRADSYAHRWSDHCPLVISYDV